MERMFNRRTILLKYDHDYVLYLWLDKGLVLDGVADRVPGVLLDGWVCFPSERGYRQRISILQPVTKCISIMTICAKSSLT